MRQKYSIDGQRVFVVGMSAGGAMTSVMGATYPDVYAAVGVHSGCEYDGYPCGASGGPDPVAQGATAFAEMDVFARVMPAIVFHGDKDTTVYPITASRSSRQWVSTDDHADDRTHNGSIATTPSSTVARPVTGGRSYSVDSYVDGAGAPLIERWLVYGMGHGCSRGCSCKPQRPDRPGRDGGDVGVPQPAPEALTADGAVSSRVGG